MNDPVRQAEYIEGYKAFDLKLVDHLPNKLPNNQIYYGWKSPGRISEFDDFAQIHLSVKVRSKKEYLEFKKQSSVQAIYIGNSNDKCLLIVKPHDEKIFTDEKNNCNKAYPVSFNAIYQLNDAFEDNWSRQENSAIVIIDCRSGDYLNRKEVLPKDGMPLKWQNGYSKGYTFNDESQTINYWSVIW